MANYTTINKSTDYFNTKLYTGNGSTNAQTGVGFQPDLTWLKCRDDTHNPNWFDAVRGVTKRIASHSTAAESTVANSLTSFNSDGFTLGSSGGENNNSNTYVSWNWKAGGGQGSSNTDGSINTTYTSVNTTAGFSISKYVGTSNTATVGHGLGVAPSMVIVKNLDTVGDWRVYHKSTGNGNLIRLNLTNSSVSTSTWNNTTPTSTVFSIGTQSDVNNSGDNIIAYCFAEKTGYSKFGSYTGNGNADGTFIYTGFKPAWVMFKKTSATDNWGIFDNKRNSFNIINKGLEANSSGAEYSSDRMDFLSNGIKHRANAGETNTSGATYIYMAFAEAPLVGTNNVPCTAR